MDVKDIFGCYFCVFENCFKLMTHTHLLLYLLNIKSMPCRSDFMLSEVHLITQVDFVCVSMTET